jgi:hypothetical protein
VKRSKTIVLSHLDSGGEDMGWRRMVRRGAVTLEASCMHAMGLVRRGRLL